VFLLARRLNTRREESLETLFSIFRLGTAPSDPLDGRFRGQLLTSTIVGPLDTFGRFMARLYIPWLGKRFDAGTQSGDNIFKGGMGLFGRLFWPTYGDYKPYEMDLLTAFPFHTSTGQGALDPGVEVLKLDYNDKQNPAFVVRDVLDELVQITGNYYLGKAYIRRGQGDYRLAAFFALQKEG